MGHIFVSYSRSKDKEITQEIVDILKDEGVNLWLDQNNINIGDNWNEVEVNALRNMEGMLVIITPNSQFSANINFETKYALKQNIPIVALFTESIPQTYFSNSELKVYYKEENWISQLKELFPVTAKNEDELLHNNKLSARGYIFISYSIADVDFVERLRHFLGEKQYAYWDYQETHREYEIPFHLEIEEAINGASAVISVVSPDWKSSKWSTREYIFSEQVGKTNFVCITRDVGPTLLYADKTFIEFFNNEENGFKTLDKALRREGLID